MTRLFKNAKKLEHRHLLEIGAMCAAVMILLFAALFVATGGMQKVNHLLALAGITSESQTACVWPCNNTAYQMQQLVPMQGGVAVSSVLTNSVVYWQWIEGSYGANNFTTLCSGARSGPNFVCTVAQNSPNTNFGACSPIACTSWSAPSCSKSGCTQTCLAYSTAVNCGNADSYNGDTCFGPNGGIPYAYSCPGYHGNPYGTTPLTAPSTPGTYNYYLCSSYQMSANNYNNSLSNLPCLGTTLTVVAPAPTCSLSPATQTVSQGSSASLSYSTTNASSVSYKVDGGTATVPAGNPFSVAGLAVGNHSVIMTVNGSGGTATCGAANNVTVTAAPAPSCTLTTISNNTTGNYSYATFSYTTANAVSATYQVDGGAAATPANNPFNLTGMSAGNHSVIMTVTNSVGATAACGSANNLTTNAIGTPTVSVTVGGASSVTVPVNGTTTIVWSTSDETPGAASVNAPSSASLGTNYGSLTGSGGSDYFSGFIVAGGYAYELGGYSGSAWVNTFWRTAVTTDITNSVWTNLGTLPSNVPASISDPFVVGSNVYIFGGYNATSAAYVGTICTAPVATMNVAANWTCPATLPAGATAALSHAYPVSIGNYLYRFGGYNGTTGVAAVARAPLSSPTSWTNFPNVLPLALMYPNPVIVGNYVYLIGGYNASAGNPINNIYRALITSDLTVPASWTSDGVLPVPIYIAAASVDTSYLYLAGGYGTGGTQLTTVYKIPLATLAAGGVVAGSWTSAGSLPTGIYPAIPFIMENKLYIAGGWNTTTGYINKFFNLPFNDGVAYTSPANLPWRTDGGNNSGNTWPLTVNSVTYTLNASNSNGASSATATVNEPDLCTNAPYSGIQNPLPGGVTVVGTTCSCTVAGNTWNGSACVAPPSPVIANFFGPTRVRKGNTATLKYRVSNPPASCTVTGTNGFSATVNPVDGVQASITTNVVTANTSFTLTCSGVSLSTSVGITPVVQEL